MLCAEVIYVKQLISRCPGCQGALRISTLQCPDCGMELKNDFDLLPTSNQPILINGDFFGQYNSILLLMLVNQLSLTVDLI